MKPDNINQKWIWAASKKKKVQLWPRIWLNTKWAQFIQNFDLVLGTSLYYSHKHRFQSFTAPQPNVPICNPCETITSSRIVRTHKSIINAGRQHKSHHKWKEAKFLYTFVINQAVICIKNYHSNSICTNSCITDILLLI